MEEGLPAGERNSRKTPALMPATGYEAARPLCKEMNLRTHTIRIAYRSLFYNKYYRQHYKKDNKKERRKGRHHRSDLPFFCFDSTLPGEGRGEGRREGTVNMITNGYTWGVYPLTLTGLPYPYPVSLTTLPTQKGRALRLPYPSPFTPHHSPFHSFHCPPADTTLHLTAYHPKEGRCVALWQPNGLRWGPCGVLASAGLWRLFTALTCWQESTQRKGETKGETWKE